MLVVSIFDDTFLQFHNFPVIDKELSACKERQEIELAAQRATLQEQRTHIDILDTALTNAQGNVVRLEEEVNLLAKKCIFVIYLNFSVPKKTNVR